MLMQLLRSKMAWMRTPLSSLHLAIRVWPPLKPILEHEAPKSAPGQPSCPLLLLILSFRSSEDVTKFPFTVAHLVVSIVLLKFTYAHVAAKLH